MKKTGKPIAAGVMNIVTGVLGVIETIGVLTGFSFITRQWTIGGVEVELGFFTPLVENSISELPIPYLIIGILALGGGIFAVIRKEWGLALAGSIIAIFLLFPLGIASTVLISMSKNEF